MGLVLFVRCSFVRRWYLLRLTGKISAYISICGARGVPLFFEGVRGGGGTPSPEFIFIKGVK